MSSKLCRAYSSGLNGKGRAMCLSAGAVRVGKFRLCAQHAAIVKSGTNIEVNIPGQGDAILTPQIFHQLSNVAEPGDIVQFHVAIQIFGGMIGFIEKLADEEGKYTVVMACPDPQRGGAQVLKVDADPTTFIKVGRTVAMLNFQFDMKQIESPFDNKDEDTGPTIIK